MGQTEDPNSDGYYLNLEPRGATWSGYEYRDKVVETLSELLRRDGLEWQTIEKTLSNDATAATWYSPTDESCCLCFEYRDGVVELIQASIPAADSEWSCRLASAIFRVIVIYQLAVEA